MEEISSISELLEEIDRTENAFENSQLWYRGQCEFDWPLIPSAYRIDSILEAQMANLFRLKAPSKSINCPNQKDYCNWLTLMRHYGLPTRLLDWSESPLISLYFSLENRESDSALWMLAPGILNRQFDMHSIPFIDNPRVLEIVRSAFISGSIQTPESFAIASYQNDQRMAMQLSNYTLHGNHKALEENKNSSQYLKKYKIKKEAKQKLLKEINILGIRQSNIFPDLQNLAKEISEISVIK